MAYQKGFKLSLPSNNLKFGVRENNIDNSSVSAVQYQSLAIRSIFAKYAIKVRY
jgi:hypothetical protein